MIQKGSRVVAKSASKSRNFRGLEAIFRSAPAFRPLGRRGFESLAAASLLAVWATASAAADAEFAIRWDPAEGGPQTANDVLAALSLKHGKETDFVVQYFTVNQPRNAVGDFKAIARERRTRARTDTTYKVRGPSPFPEADPIHKWGCPLSIPALSKDEVDISWTGEQEPKRAFSRSCTAEVDIAHAMPKELGAKPLGCISKMHRIEINGIKLEEWDLQSGKRLFEVSTNGQDSASDLEKFRSRIVNPLLGHKVKPLEDSKTELGSSC
jgi:hypothetical protein